MIANLRRQFAPYLSVENLAYYEGGLSGKRGYLFQYGLNFESFSLVLGFVSEKTSETILFHAKFYKGISACIANSRYKQELHFHDLLQVRAKVNKTIQK